MERIKRAFAIQLDFAKTNSINTNYTYKQYDYGANEIGIQVLFDGKVVQLDDEKVFAVFKNKDNELFLDKNKQPLKSFARIYSSEDGLIILPLPSDLMQTSGEVVAELMVVAKDHSKRLTSASFKFNIVESITYLDLTNEKPIFDTICGLYKCGEVLCAKNGSYAREGYDKTIWIDGETLIDAEKLNKIENTLEILKVESDNTKDYVDNTFQPKGDYVEKQDADNSYQPIGNYANEEHTHYATEVIEDETHRFVTNEEKEKWDNKSDFSGDYEDLENKPSIPSRTSDLTNDSGYITIDDVDTSQNHTHTNKEVIDAITSEKINSWDNKSDFDGDYNSLENKPNIPSIEGLVSKEELNGVIEELVETIDAKANVSDLESLATKEQVEELKTTLEEHLENHPSGKVNDYGTLDFDGKCKLYSYGNEFEEVTGGWKTHEFNQRHYPSLFTKNEDNLYSAEGKDYSKGGWITSKPIDVNNAKAVKVTYKSSGYNNNFCIHLAPVSNPIDEKWNYYTIYSDKGYEGTKTVEIDISKKGFSGEMYVYVQSMGQSYSNETYEFWLYDLEIIYDNQEITIEEVQQLRGTTEQISEYEGKEGQIVVNTDDNTIHIMDGVTNGGTKLATEKFVEEIIKQIECEPIDLTNFYTKEEVEERLEQIECEGVDLQDYYNKEEIDNLLKDLPSSSDGYTKEEIDNMLKDVPKLLEDMDAILTYIVGCDHSEEIALLDIINGEVI